jgi:hypothetical protein
MAHLMTEDDGQNGEAERCSVGRHRGDNLQRSRLPREKRRIPELDSQQSTDEKRRSDGEEKEDGG